MPMLVGPSRKGFLGRLTGKGSLMQQAGQENVLLKTLGLFILCQNKVESVVTVYMLGCRTQEDGGQGHCNSGCICTVCSQRSKHRSRTQCGGSERRCESCGCCTQADASSDLTEQR